MINLLIFVVSLFAVMVSANQTDINMYDVLDRNFDHNQIIVYKFLETQKSSYIVFVKDNQNRHYLVKQEKNPILTSQFRSIAETLCAHIANEVGIPSQQVKIIPVGVPFPGKFITNRVSTLHTVVPGKTIRSCPEGPYAKLNIKQDAKHETPCERQGITKNTIFWMSQHSDLPLIVALDTFVGNRDRNKANILYDEETDSFHAIDMGTMYDVLSDRRRVAQIACDQISTMLDSNVVFTEKELEALRLYRSTLKKLILLFPPHKMNDLFDTFFQESGIAQSPLYNTKEISAMVNMYKRAIKQSYIDIKRLIYLLFLLINH